MTAERKDMNELARQLLESGDVEVVIGYAAGGQPLTATPAFVRDPDRADAFIFDRSCEYNLANYLHRFKDKKVAIVVKGCDERSVIGLIQEKQVERDNLVLIGAPCSGVIDPAKVQRLAKSDAVRDAKADDESVTVTTLAGEEVVVPIADVLYAGCAECAVRNPRFTDYVIADPVEQPEAPDYSPEMEELAASSSDERWAAFSREMGKCILCLACRNLCPACYCHECFCESSQPKWLGKTDDPADAMFFHMTRLLHLAGRCTGCGACARGCPANVNLRVLNDRLRKDVKEVFEFEAGMDPEADAPFTCFRVDDENNFIM